MRIGIAGAGPGGLYFALLMKKQYPEARIRVVEQNAANATYGWGVVFSSRALAFLEASDLDSYREIQRSLEQWEDQALVHNSTPVIVDGLAFAGLARLHLLRILQARCLAVGVELEFNQRLDNLSTFRDCDLIVGADGANSVVRRIHEVQFRTRIETLTNKYAWYGTSQLFDRLSLTFRQNNHGTFCAHHYRYSASVSTFVVECDANTYEQSRLEHLTADGQRAYCEALFQPDLGGHPLLTNNTAWINFRLITNETWTFDNVVLIGDALRTVHFSIGSGTRTALEDAIVLAQAFSANTDVKAALARFESIRKPTASAILDQALRSARWYEQMGEKMNLAPLAFAHDYLVRGGAINEARLREKSPHFAAAYAAYLAASSSRRSEPDVSC